MVLHPWKLIGKYLSLPQKLCLWTEALNSFDSCLRSGAKGRLLSGRHQPGWLCRTGNTWQACPLHCHLPSCSNRGILPINEGILPLKVPVVLFSSLAKVSLLTPATWPCASLQTILSSDLCFSCIVNCVQKTTSLCGLHPDSRKISVYSGTDIAPGSNEVKKVWYRCWFPSRADFLKHPNHVPLSSHSGHLLS